MEQQVTRDIAGEESISRALLTLLAGNPYGLDFGFATLDSDFSLYPTGGSAVLNERRSITGHVAQECAYSFALVSHGWGQNSQRKMNAKDMLDQLGRWIEGHPITIDGTVYQLDHWPELTDGRVVRSIARTSTATLEGIGEDQSELWSISARLVYTYEFDAP